MSQTATLPVRKPRATRVVAKPATATYTTAGLGSALAEIPRLRLAAELVVLFLELVLLVSLGTV